MNLPESVFDECYESIKSLDLDSELVVFGEYLAMYDPSLGAAPTNKKQLGVNAETWFRRNVKSLCELVRSQPALRVVFLPSELDETLKPAYGAALALYSLSFPLGPLSLKDEAGFIFFTLLTWKHGFNWICKTYGQC